MALKKYEWNGGFWQFEDGKQPEGAKPLVEEKARAAVQNKSRKPTNKTVKDA